MKAKPVKATAAAGAQLDDRKPAHASTRSWERSLAYRILNADKIAERSRLYRAANRNILTPKQIAAALARVGR
ncbi:MAG: hypothetical protein NT062_36020 [Proteobacteria bacterium]|nr:hypothetical protein [Pseudomonadota bacterium]